MDAKISGFTVYFVLTMKASYTVMLTKLGRVSCSIKSSDSTVQDCLAVTQFSTCPIFVDF